MDEEWRVRLIPRDPSADRKPASADAVRDLLRSRSGVAVSVTAGKAGVFLYAATEDAAVAAEATAREVLAQQGLTADIRLERWDPSRQEWLPPGEAPPADLPPVPGQERNPGRRRLRAAGALIEAIMDAISSSP
ncbi:MAG: hypothetical protein ACRDNW_14790 [Trebonia sp.]